MATANAHQLAIRLHEVSLDWKIPCTWPLRFSAGVPFGVSPWRDPSGSMVHQYLHVMMLMRGQADREQSRCGIVLSRGTTAQSPCPKR